MNTETGEIREWSEIEVLPEDERRKYIPMNVPPTVVQRERKRVDKYDPCPCGSGEKFKFCCYRKPSVI
jgi:uncharacterized protein YecA (UPF0149 family)